MAQVKPIVPGAVDLQDSETQKAPEYLKAQSGRVFVATPQLVKQFRKKKFGMIEITEAQYKAELEKESKQVETVQDEEKENLAKENADLKAKVEAMEKEAAEKAGSTTKRTTATKA